LKLLLDTHLLLWSAYEGARLSAAAQALIEDPQNELVFSVVSIWEVAIKSTLKRADFQADARVLRRALLDNGYQELIINSAHAVSIDSLPVLHKDPFDRLLLAQANVEGFVFVTADSVLAQYPGSIRYVG
jgi:PIN domain nuclease of toxin-antitoxin system